MTLISLQKQIPRPWSKHLKFTTGADDKKTMRIRVLLILNMLFLSACATLAPRDPEIPIVNTVKTDLYLNGLSRAEYYRQMAESYHQEKLIDKSIEYYKLALLHNPKYVDALIGLSQIYDEQGHFLLAIVALQDAKKIQPNNLVILKKMGDLYLNAGIYAKAREIYGEILKLNEKHEDSLWAYYFILKLERKYEEALFTLAQIGLTKENEGKLAFEKSRCYFYLKDYDLYDHYLSEAVKLNPREKEAVLSFAIRSYEKEKFEEAKDALLNLSNTNAFDLEVSQHLAFAAVQSAHYLEAIREFDKQISVVPNPTPILLKKAHALFLLEDLAGAEKLYTKLVVETFSDEARYFLGQIYFEQKKFDEATTVLQQIPPFSEFFGEAAVKLSLYNKYIGNEDEAINILHDAFTRRSDVLQVYQAYADFLIESKKYIEAVALIEKAMGYYPTDEQLRLKMAYLHFMLNNQKSFKKQIDAALKINPQSAEAYAMLSELWYLKERSPDEIIYFTKRALELKSRNKNVKPILAWALMQVDRSTEAVAIFEEFYEENPRESFFTRSLSQVYSRGGVKEKAKQLDEIAAKIENNQSLKSRFIFRRETSQVNAEEFKENKTRLPSSLENYQQ